MSTHPIIFNQLPDPNFIGAQLDAPIFFRAEDSDGVDVSTLRVIINGVNAVLNGVYQTGFTGTVTNEDHVPKTISVLIYHSTNFSWSQTVQVAVHIENFLGNPGAANWAFLTIPNPDITAPLVAANPHGGTYNVAQTITLTSTEPVTIYYTLDGSEPTLVSPVYSAPIVLSSEGTITLKFVGVDSASNYDQNRVEKYVLDFTAPIATATPSGGSYFSSQQIVLSSNDPKATIFYTTNGLTPTTSSPVYTVPLSIADNQNTTLKFFAVDKAGNSGAVQTEVYTVAIAKNNYIVRNVSVRYNYFNNEFGILWEDMYPIITKIIGYNIYRADFEFGKYLKLNNDLISINQYIDKTLDTQIVNEDVGEQFRRTVTINKSIDDDFTGQCYDSSKWKETDLAQLLFQYKGLVFTDKTGLKQESKLTSKFKLRGDFDIQIGYNFTNWQTPLSAIQSCIFRIKREDTNYIQVAREQSPSSNVYSSNKYTGGNPDLPATTSTVDDYGTFRIVRLANVIMTYYLDKNTGDFIQMQSLNWFTDDLYIEIVGRSAEVPIEFWWTGFKLNSGRPIIIEPMNQLKEYIIQTSKIPIVDSSGTNKPTDDISEVSVTINGEKAYIRKLQGLEGHIYLETTKVFDDVTKKYFEPPVPDEYSVVSVTYKTKYHTAKLNLDRNYFYKVTAVTAEDETDLDLVEPKYVEQENISYIYQEAIRRNSWLRDQAGERVLVYIKKRAGEPCPCTLRDVKQRSHRKPDKDCPICFGSSFQGGFFGPVPIIIGNLTAEHRINQTERGLKLLLQVETWTGPFPVITQRDMIIRRNGDRCLVGPVTKVEGPGGVVVQQHFSIDSLDSTDIRFQFPIQPLQHQFIENSPGIDKDGTRVPEVTSAKEREELVTSMNKVPNNENKNVDRQVRGRSLTFENNSY